MVSIKGLNHLLFSVSNLEDSVEFYKNVFDAKLLAKGRSTAYLDLNGIKAENMRFLFQKTKRNLAKQVGSFS
jgi:catechol 2,3-dioxygenase-like lactoylglutathione lyase family enzyme